MKHACGWWYRRSPRCRITGVVNDDAAEAGAYVGADSESGAPRTDSGKQTAAGSAAISGKASDDQLGPDAPE